MNNTNVRYIWMTFATFKAWVCSRYELAHLHDQVEGFWDQYVADSTVPRRFDEILIGTNNVSR